MNRGNLVDMFGLSGDPVKDDQLDALLFRLESEITNSSPTGSTDVVFRSSLGGSQHGSVQSSGKIRALIRAGSRYLRKFPREM